jgi:hypothetical protein
MLVKVEYYLKVKNNEVNVRPLRNVCLSEDTLSLLRHANLEEVCGTTLIEVNKGYLKAYP